MTDKREERLRRAKRTRMKIRELETTRLSVFRTPRHIYAQITTPAGDRVLASASTVEKDLRAGATGNAEAAARVGQLIAERAKAAGVSKVAFDRSGFQYHGRIKALADAARENGLEF
jgi:large subunit ribosomal protein L18